MEVRFGRLYNLVNEKVRRLLDYIIFFKLNSCSVSKRTWLAKFTKLYLSLFRSTLACLIFLCLADLGSGKDAWVLFGVMVQWLFPNWNDLCIHFLDSIVSSTTYKHLIPVGGTAAGPLPGNLRTQVRVPYHAKIWICQRRPMLKTHYSCLTSKWHNFFQVTASVII